MKYVVKAWGSGLLLVIWLITGCQGEVQKAEEPRKNQQLPVAAAHILGDLTYQDVLQEGEVVHVANMPTQSGQIWVGTHRGLFVSADNKTWGLLSPELEGKDVTGWVVNPDNPNDIYVAGYQLSKKSTDGGQSWEDAVAGLPSAPDIRNVAGVGSGEKQVLYVTVSGDGIYRSADGGQHWKKWMVFEQAAYGMEYDAADDSMYVATQEGIWKSENNSWVKEDIPADSQVYSLAADNLEGVLYAATSDGILQKTNRGWEPFDTQSPERLVVISASGANHSLIGIGESAYLYVLQQEGWKKWE
ncbi:MAG: WD40/YVTN/BNR-like repeat-containing protein [Clostridia bacterium]